MKKVSKYRNEKKGKARKSEEYVRKEIAYAIRFVSCIIFRGKSGR